MSSQQNQYAHQKPHLVPITTNTEAEPFEVIAMDFIVKLPKSQGYDTILTITDHDCSKAAIFIPCNETITAEGVVDLIIKHVFPHYGFPRRVISDRDPRFMSRFMKHFYQKTGTKQNVSTAYHPQTDGQSERSNQWVEQYLRHICNLQQDNWAEALPLAQFTHNVWPNATTKETPFSLIMGWTPRATWTNTPSAAPSADKRMEELQIRRQHVQDSITQAQLLMARKGNSTFTPYQQGAMVWLEGVNLRTLYPTSKLAPKCYGPFPIKRVLSEVTYELELPPQWTIHPVFHAKLLTPYKETAMHGTNYTRPPPDLIKGEAEYEVEQILDAHRRGRGRKLQYYIKWKGFPMSDSTWEPTEHLDNAQDLITDFYHLHPMAEGAPKDV